MKSHLIVLSVVLLGIFLRIVQFGQIPSGVNRDEAALGYNALSILKTGMDEHGQKFPLQFESFGDWKKPVYVYLSTIPIALTGLNVQSVRSISLIAGFVLTLFLYKLLCLKYSNHPLLKYVGAMSLIFMALNPWHFFFSRIAVEAMVAVSLFIVGIYLWELKRPLYASSLFIVCLYTYHASLIVIPLWLIAQYIIFQKSYHRKSYLLALTIMTLVVAIQFMATFFSAEKAKAKGLVIFDLTISEQLSILGKRNHPLSIFVHNKYIYIGKSLVTNYVKTFTPEFLIKKGGSNPSYNIPGFGNFYWIEIILAIVGTWYIVKHDPKRHSWLLSTLLIAPLPAALTHEAIHSTREIFMLPAVVALSSIGASWLISNSINHQIAKIAIVGLLFANAGPFYYRYFFEYPAQSDRIYHGYMKKVVIDQAQIAQSGQYKAIYTEFFRESPYIFYAFYNQLDPIKFHQTIQWYPPDYEGFVHAKQLDSIRYEGRDESAIFYNIIERENNLVYSKPTETESWIKPLKVWDNLDGGAEIISWQEKQI